MMSFPCFSIKYQKRISLFYQFYKRFFFLNFFISLPISIFSLSYMDFLFFFCSAGLFLSFIFFEYFEFDYYYYYFNRGITKTNLIVVSFILNILFSAMVIILFMVCHLN